MYQVLLVDDEALITDGLAEYLARRAPERFEILKAYSGAGALEIAGRMRVDILVTDIEMLGLDGLAVRRRVQALWPQCRAIFLTAHANFEYAYQAIQDPPARYLLKSEGFERLAQILEQTAAELDEALYNESLLREAQNAREGNLQKVMLLSAILRGEMGEEEEMARGFAELGIDLRAGEAVLPLLVRLYAPARQGYRLAAVSGYIRRQADGACLCEAGDIFDVADPRSEFENSVISEMQIASFAESIITEKDREILKLRMEGYTEQEIADKVGHKTASAVHKRIARIADAYEDYVTAEYGQFLDKH